MVFSKTVYNVLMADVFAPASNAGTEMWVVQSLAGSSGAGQPQILLCRFSLYFEMVNAALGFLMYVNASGIGDAVSYTAMPVDTTAPTDQFKYESGEASPGINYIQRVISANSPTLTTNNIFNVRGEFVASNFSGNTGLGFIIAAPLGAGQANNFKMFKGSYVEQALMG